MLTEFLERLGEWEGGRDNAAVRALVLDSIPRGRATGGVRAAALDWFEAHPGSGLVAGVVLGGLAGLAIASATLAIASRRPR